jgi:hypothetical protein
MREPATKADVFYAVIGGWVIAPSIVFLMYILLN